MVTIPAPRRAVLALLGLGVFLLAGRGYAAPPADTRTRADGASADHEQRVEDYFARRPLTFEPNRGQADPRVRFLARSRSGLLFLTDDQAIMALPRPDAPPETLRLRFVGGRPVTPEVASAPLSGYSNYLIGNDPSRWQTEIPHYSRAAYRGVYPGVDVVFYGTSERQIEYDFVVAPGADLSRIRLRVDGARRLRIDDLGDLHIVTAHGEVVQKAPIVYQEVDGQRRLLPGRYVKRGRREVGFEVDGYDPDAPLVLDPVLTWASYHGGGAGTTFDSVNGIAVLETGANTGVFITGRTTSTTGFPISPTGVDQTFAGAGEAFVARINLAGTALIYSTYLGGSNDDQGNGIAALGGDAYVTGFTASGDFPTASAAQIANAGLPGTNDAFVSAINPGGTGFAYSTYLGGTGDDQGRAITVNASREAFVTGRAGTGFLTTAGAFDTTFNGPGGGSDGFVARYGTTGTKTWATYLGGNGAEQAQGIALDVNGIIVVGFTASTNFPLQTPIIQGANAGLNDAFITKMSLTGNALVFSTYRGGAGDDQAHAVSLTTGALAGIYVAGQTSGGVPGFPLLGPLQTAYGGGASDAFVMKIATSGASVLYSTYLGGNGIDLALGIAAEDSGSATVTGGTTSNNFPTVAGVDVFQGGRDAFITSLVPAGCSTSYSTYIGGSLGPATEQGNAIAIGPTVPGRVYVGGSTSNAFPVTAGAFDLGYNGGTTDGFVLLLDSSPLADIQVNKTGAATVSAGSSLTYSLNVQNLGPNGAQDVVVTDTLPAGLNFVSSVPGAPVCNFITPVLTCTLSCLASTATTIITINTTVGDLGPTNVLINNTAQRISSSPNDPNITNDTSQWGTTVTPSSDLSIVKLDTPDPVDLGADVTYTLQVTNNGPSTASGVQVVDTLPPGTTFVSANSPTFACLESAGTVTCNHPLNFPPSTTEFITIVATVGTTGTLLNVADVTASQPDPNPFNNSAQASTTVTVPAAAFKVFTATSTGGPAAVTGRNLLQWVNPAGGPFVDIRIRFNQSTPGTSDCTFPASPTAGPFTGQFLLGPPAGAKQEIPHNSLLLDTAYCYSAWVEITPGVFSIPRTVKARPFDSTSVAVPIRWAYSTGATSVVPPGLSASGVVTVSNDRVLHSMVREGANGGEWPGPWLPPVFGGAAQTRPPVVPTTVVAGSTKVVFVGTQDGLVRAVDADSGLPKWTSPPLGSVVQAAPAGMFSALGGAFDQVFIGTRDAGANNRLYALDAATGTQLGPFFDNGPAPGSGIGIVNGGASVDYVNNRVFFTSRDNAIGSLKTIWAMNIGAGGITPYWSRELQPTDASPVLRGGRLYVGGNSGNVYSQAADDTGFYFVNPGDGAVRGFIFPDRDSASVYFSTQGKIWGFTDTGTGFTQNWLEATLPGGGNQPSALIYVRGTTLLYVGGSDGKLYELDFAAATPFIAPIPKSVTLGDGLSVIGQPSIDTLASPNLIYVGSEAGVVYAVEVPLP